MLYSYVNVAYFQLVAAIIACMPSVSGGLTYGFSAILIPQLQDPDPQLQDPDPQPNRKTDPDQRKIPRIRIRGFCTKKNIILLLCEKYWNRNQEFINLIR